jgi:hypothetical protein
MPTILRRNYLNWKAVCFKWSRFDVKFATSGQSCVFARPQDNRLNCVVVRSDRLPLVLRRGDRGGGTSTRFSARRSREDDGEHGAGADCASREALWFLTPWHSVALPVFSVLKAFLDCGRHVFHRLSEAMADSSDCPGPSVPHTSSVLTKLAAADGRRAARLAQADRAMGAAVGLAGRRCLLLSGLSSERRMGVVPVMMAWTRAGRIGPQSMWLGRRRRRRMRDARLRCWSA